MSRKPLNWIDLATQAKAAPGESSPDMSPDFPARVWDALQAQPSSHSKAWKMTGLGWIAAAAVAISVSLLVFNRDLLDLSLEPNSPLVDELVVCDWTALDSPL